MKHASYEDYKRKDRLTVSGILIFIFTSIWCLPLQAQHGNKTFEEIEKTQDDIEDLYVEIYGIIDQYPDVSYHYMYTDGEMTSVMIEGIPNNRDKKQLEVYLIDMEQLKKEIANLRNRVGVYYVADTEPRPKMGYEAFYDQLINSIKYPDEAEDRAIEGVIYVKFLIDATGEIDHISTSETLETPANWIVDDMVKEAVRAVKATSGEWIPAKVGVYPVSHWVVLPVQFKLKEPYFTPLY